MADTAAAATPAAPAGGTGTPTPGQQPAPNAVKPGETQAQAEARRLKLLLDGKEVELPETEVATNYQKGKEASKLLSKVEQRRQEALKAKAEAEGLMSRLKDKGNVRKTLLEMGYTKEDLREMSQAEILEAIEEEKLSPAERRAKEAEAKVKEYETEKQKAEREKQEAAFKEEVERHKDELASHFLQVMEQTGLPQSAGRFVLPRVAALYQQNLEAGLDSSTEEMTAYVLEGLKAEHQGMLSGLEGEALVQHLGPDVVKKVLAHHLAKAREKRGMGAAPKPPAQPLPQAPAATHPRKGRWEMIDQLLKG